MTTTLMVVDKALIERAAKRVTRASPINQLSALLTASLSPKVQAQTT